MTEQIGPRWQPITRLAQIAAQIDGILVNDFEQYENLQQARSKPWVLYDFTAGRVVAVFTVQRDDLWLFDEQLRRWGAENLTTTQRVELGRLTSQMLRLYAVTDTILSLAYELQRSTFEKQLAQSDIQSATATLRQSDFAQQPDNNNPHD